MTTDQLASLHPAIYENLVDLALREDLGAIDVDCDLTAAWTVDSAAEDRARIIARQPGVVAGIEIARAVFARLDDGISFLAQVEDGAEVAVDHALIQLQGRARALLAGERTALNFLQQLSGVATLTHRFVAAVAATSAQITDTRKTTPGWRQLQKWAVQLGGGVNHRMGLYDAVLIKENHAAATGGTGAAVAKARLEALDRAVPIFVETEDLDEVQDALSEGPDRIMLDNMDADTMRRAVDLIRSTHPTIEIEATGGYTLETVREAADTGVDLISIGALTHSAPALDMSMLFAGK
ncbi:MAG: carboxylating nicotinate-nucleotide diphosphorylase [Candidatus Latescibacterota bacterium]|nr:carboxylating nicotinate-nucleotide diphosphorylase [Candidatus Latescibacterota bacterium]